MNFLFSKFLLRVFLRLCGIYLDDDGKTNFFRKIHFPLMIVGCLVNIVSLILRLGVETDLNERIDSAIYLAHVGHSFCILLTVRAVSRSSVAEIIETCRRPFYRYPSEMRLPSIEQTESRLDASLKWTTPIAYCIYASVCLVPVPHLFLGGWAHPIIPYWLPLPTDPHWLYLVAYCFEAFLTIIGCLVLPGVMIFVLNFTATIAEQWNMLNTAVKRIGSLEASSSHKNRIEKRNERYIRHCIRHHGLILRYYFRNLLIINIRYNALLNR